MSLGADVGEPFFVWDESMSIGVPLIDHDHQYLVDLVNQLHDAIGGEDEREMLATVLDALVDYAVYHFGREERVMEACDAPDVVRHRRQHEVFSRKVLDIQQRFRDNRDARLGQDVLEFLKKWLLGHILGEDTRIRQYAAGRPAAVRAAAMVPRLVLNLPGGSGVPAIDWKTLKVLLVDGNAGFRKVLSTVLSTVDPKAVREAADGQAALEVLKDFTPDVVVTDWFIDDMDAIAFFAKARALRDDLADLPFVVLLGPENETFARAARAEGVEEFLEKPVTAKGLLIAVARAAMGRG